MNWRRFLWVSMSALLAWGLYLYLPPKPRWTLPEYEVPLKVAVSRTVTMVLDPEKRDRPTLQPEAFTDTKLGGFSWFGPIRLRDSRTGHVVAELPDHEDAWSVCHISQSLRFALCQNFDHGSISCYDFTTPSRWNLEKVQQSYFSPLGTLVHVWLDDQDQLRDAATGKVITEFAPRYRFLYHFAADDSWALFAGSDEQDTESSWLLWRREGNAISKGVFPGIVQGPGHKQGFRLAPNGRRAAIHVLHANRHRLVVWDIVRGVLLHEPKSLARDDTAFEFSSDGKRLAVWSNWDKSLELFEVESGRRVSFTHGIDIRDCGFSANGELLWYIAGAFPQTVGILTVPELQERWSVKHQLEFDAPKWLKSDPSRWALRKSAFDVAGRKYVVAGAVVVDSRNGHEVMSWQDGDLSLDNFLMVRIQKAGQGEARGRFDAILRWLPWIRDKEFLHVTAERLDDGREVLRRPIMYSTGEPPETHSPYSDDETLVLMCAGRDTEIWDLPPARRWVWIAGPSAVFAALPWLWQLARRKTSKRAGSVNAPAA